MFSELLLNKELQYYGIIFAKLCEITFPKLERKIDYHWFLSRNQKV